MGIEIKSFEEILDETIKIFKENFGECYNLEYEIDDNGGSVNFKEESDLSLLIVELSVNEYKKWIQLANIHADHIMMINDIKIKKRKELEID